jgi:6-pyruvoyltetrahydropterin/6-carboxytetrahydropterin synthase
LKTKIGKHFDFESAHQLKGSIYGKCQNLHGHRYHLVVEVEGEVDQFGWVCDFAEIEDIVKKMVVDKFDHKNLNDFFELSTAENIAKFVFEALDGELKTKPYRLSKVLLYETADSYAEIAR